MTNYFIRYMKMEWNRNEWKWTIIILIDLYTGIVLNKNSISKIRNCLEFYYSKY